ncbi:hypothetical protein [Woodsholea maritima]|uniref:hypothetical protein n=1 Tax=Woodsholea maritima TaxID=240237 RepID=UPI0003782F0C|nr:hypothetical protein [Woodsholea maritima]
MTNRIYAILAGLCLWTLSACSLAQDEPPRADAFENAENFLACRGNGYALCYYSGPADDQPTKPGTSSPPLPCNPNVDDTAACTCYAFDDGMYNGELSWNYVLIGSILNREVREEAMLRCHEDGSNCLNMKSLHGHCREVDGVIAESEDCLQAPVCSYLGNPAEGIPQTLYPNLENVSLISTFSFAYSDVHEFGSTECSNADNPSYAGCMTAPCIEDENGLTSCQCPTFEGPYQVGQTYDGLTCAIDGHIWSAAYHETSEDSADGEE